MIVFCFVLFFFVKMSEITGVLCSAIYREGFVMLSASCNKRAQSVFCGLGFCEG